MNIIEDSQKCLGTIERIVEYRDGRVETLVFNNTVLKNGKAALAKCLANQVGDQFEFSINRMLFGNGGTVASGEPKAVQSERLGLYGSTVANKPVIASIDAETSPTQVVFTSVLTFDDAAGDKLSEVAIQMYNKEIYSMATFADLSKTSQMQITWNWRLTFV